jgi:Family of unknown function (DUF6174)
MTIRALLLMAFAVAAAALAAPVLAQEPPNPTDPSIASGKAEKALDRARAQWKKAKIRSYDYEARRSCFCPTTGWHKVKVRRNHLSGTPHNDVKDIATVPRLFKIVQRAIDKKSHKLTVSYGTYGVPKQISIDSIANVIDEEQYFTVRRFKRR